MIKKLNALKNQKGMTLVELLAVMVIIGIIAAISIPAIGNLMENSRKDAHISNAQALQESGRLWATSNEAYLTQIFTKKSDATVTIKLANGQWDVTDNANVTGLTINGVAPFEGYLETFVDPHSKGAYSAATLQITRDGDAYKYAVALTGSRAVVGQISDPTQAGQSTTATPVDAMSLTRANVKTIETKPAS